jgi:hypothetical protein
MGIANTSKGSGARLHGGLSTVERGLLASSDEKLSILHGRVLQNSMAKIEDVADAVEFRGEVERGLPDFFGWAEENGWVEVPLNSNARTSKPAEFRERDTPINAENVSAGF